MAKLLMLRGLPACGKTTHATEQLKTGNWVRLNKDLLRTMLHNDKFSGRNEGLTMDAEYVLAQHFLTHNKNVIIDDTNLLDHHKERWSNLAKETNSTFEIKDFSVSLEELIERDKNREKSVGFDVIKRLALQSGRYPAPNKGFIICDIDGTVADLSHRLHYVKVPDGQKKDWKSFFENISDDKPRKEIVEQIFAHFVDGYDIVFVSGRPDTYKKETVKWLNKNIGIGENYALLMRKGSDSRDDDIVKEEILNTYFPDKSLIKKVYDDRKRVIDMWVRNGLDVVNVGGENNDF